jgi:hypothetical protein
MSDRSRASHHGTIATHRELLMTALSANSQKSTFSGSPTSGGAAPRRPELTTLIYLDVLAGGTVEQVAAKYGLRAHDAIERVEAARLCYDRQVEMREFPVHLL